VKCRLCRSFAEDLMRPLCSTTLCKWKSPSRRHKRGTFYCRIFSLASSTSSPPFSLRLLAHLLRRSSTAHHGLHHCSPDPHPGRRRTARYCITDASRSLQGVPPQKQSKLREGAALVRETRMVARCRHSTLQELRWHGSQVEAPQSKECQRRVQHHPLDDD
jgi:hypothetical protein